MLGLLQQTGQVPLFPFSIEHLLAVSYTIAVYIVAVDMALLPMEYWKKFRNEVGFLFVSVAGLQQH